MEKYTETELDLAAQIGALRYACFQCLALLLNGDAEAQDAERIISLLETILEA